MAISVNVTYEKLFAHNVNEIILLDFALRRGPGTLLRLLGTPPQCFLGVIVHFLATKTLEAL